MHYGSLHTRSHFSFLAGASSPDELAARAHALGHSFVGLTDRMGVYGAVRLQRACATYDLKPIIGAEVTVEGAPIVLIARSMRGYTSLCSLLTVAHQRDRSDPQVTLDDCAQYRDDLICLTGGREGRYWQHMHARDHDAAQQWLQALRSVYGSDVVIELLHHRRPRDGAIAERMVAMGAAMQIDVCIGGDVRYATADDYMIYDVMTCTREGITIFDHHTARPVNDQQCLRSYRDLSSLLPYPQAFATMARIADACSYDILPDHITPPGARLPEGVKADDVLRALCNAAFTKRYANDAENVEYAADLLEHELTVICDLALADFFLVVHEVTQEARRQGIRCSGRGSAANSIVAYLLGITGVDPIRHHLLFERFLHRGRKGTPDIDVDFDSDRRNEVITWMEERFGPEQTAMTGTLITYRLRMAVRDAAKALGWPMEVVNAMSKAVPGYTNKPIADYAEELATVVGPSPLLQTLLHVVERMLDRPRHLGLHSGGMILSARPLTTLTPVQVSANGVTVVQFDKDDVEAMGLVKFDVLGLRMLACISETLELIERYEGHRPDVDELSLDDPHVFQMIKDGRTLGVFQIESQGQMHLLAQHQPDCFDDLVSEVALFRPGPLQGGMVNPYVRRRRGQEPVQYLHPDLEPILRDTLGIVLFQEQVLEIAHKFAGMSLQDADDFRALVSKNRDLKALAIMRERFIRGAMQRGVDLAAAEAVYDKVSHFVGYGFCRSHAAAFAKIVYQSAWLKHYHPAAYLAAFMQHRPGFYNLMTLEEEARRCGVEVLLPDINASWFRYELAHSSTGALAIRKPLTSIKGCTEDLARSILWARLMGPFTSTEDLIRRVDLDVDVASAIALSGALDGLARDSRTAMWEVGVALKRKARPSLDFEAQTSVFDLPLVMDDDVPHLPTLRAQERLAYDYMTHRAARLHPMTLYRRALNDMEVRTIATAFRSTVKEITIGGIVILRQSPPTAHGVLFVTLEDETGFVQCVVQPEAREQFSQHLRKASLIIRGKVHAVNNWRGIVVTDVRPLTGVIGGYYGHPAMYGGTDEMEMGKRNTEYMIKNSINDQESRIQSRI